MVIIQYLHHYQDAFHQQEIFMQNHLQPNRIQQGKLILKNTIFKKKTKQKKIPFYTTLLIIISLYSVCSPNSMYSFNSFNFTLFVVVVPVKYFYFGSQSKCNRERIEKNTHERIFITVFRNNPFDNINSEIALLL